MRTTGTVSIVVVVHDSTHLLPGFGEALGEALHGIEQHEIILVDSGSTDDSLARFSQLMPGAVGVDLNGNLGYAAGLNAGVRATTLGGPVLLLNPDIRPQLGSFAALVDALSDPSVGISVPRLVNDHGETQRSLRRRPTLLRAFGEAVLGGTVAGRFPAFGEIVQDPHAYERPSNVDWSTGAVMCIARPCLEATGAWDESYFLYSEETDFALRAQTKGYCVRYVPTSVVVHIGGDLHISPTLFALLNLNRVRSYGARHGRCMTMLFRAGIALGLAVRAIAGSRRHRAAISALFEDPSVVVERARRDD
jgi:GT2 family glycosyltransferase